MKKNAANFSKENSNNYDKYLAALEVESKKNLSKYLKDEQIKPLMQKLKILCLKDKLELSIPDSLVKLFQTSKETPTSSKDSLLKDLLSQHTPKKQKNITKLLFQIKSIQYLKKNPSLSCEKSFLYWEAIFEEDKSRSVLKKAKKEKPHRINEIWIKLIETHPYDPSIDNTKYINKIISSLKKDRNEFINKVKNELGYEITFKKERKAKKEEDLIWLISPARERGKKIASPVGTSLKRFLKTYKKKTKIEKTAFAYAVMQCKE